MSFSFLLFLLPPCYSFCWLQNIFFWMLWDCKWICSPCNILLQAYININYIFLSFTNCSLIFFSLIFLKAMLTIGIKLASHLKFGFRFIFTSLLTFAGPKKVNFPLKMFQLCSNSLYMLCLHLKHHLLFLNQKK